MENLFRWASTHVLTVLLILGVIYAVVYVLTHRKTLFYKK